MTTIQKVILSVLVIVVLGTVAAVLATNVGWVANKDPTIAKNFATWGSGSVLAEIVALFILIGRKAFNLNSRVSFQITPASDFPTLNPGRIRWKEASCFVKTDRLQAPVKLIVSQIGQTWSVHIPPRVIEKIADTDWIEFRFEDDRGNTWAAGPILKNEYVIPLQTLDAEKVRQAYRNPDQ